jgi:hypothetical protein
VRVKRVGSYGRGVMWSVLGLALSALVAVGLLTGACSSSQPRGNCFRPGVCYYTSPAGEPLYSCSRGDHFAVGECGMELHIGACVSQTQTVHLYAPLHGLGTPDCTAIAGPGYHFVRD